jgi:hypothetical protein
MHYRVIWISYHSPFTETPEIAPGAAEPRSLCWSAGSRPRPAGEHPPAGAGCYAGVCGWSTTACSDATFVADSRAGSWQLTQGCERGAPVGLVPRALAHVAVVAQHLQVGGHECEMGETRSGPDMVYVQGCARGGSPAALASPARGLECGVADVLPRSRLVERGALHPCDVVVGQCARIARGFECSDAPRDRRSTARSEEKREPAHVIFLIVIS